MNFAVVTNFNIPDKAATAFRVIELLREKGCGVFTADFNRDRISRNKGNANYDYITYLPIEKLYQSTDIAVILGGDGTILEAARRAVPAGKPMLGINLGTLGYMAELEVNEIERIAEVIDGKYRLDERMVLKIEIFDEKEDLKQVSFAINDAVISNGSISRILDLSLLKDDEEVCTYRADGVIIATPTGSTAYSMAAGGSIMDPNLRGICVTPICPHSLTSKQLIFPDVSKVEIKNRSVREKKLFLTLDGKSSYELELGDVVKFTKSMMKAKLIRLKSDNFYKKLRQKFETI